MMKGIFVCAALALSCVFASPGFAADTARGEQIAHLRCAVCHTFDAGAKQKKVGPPLHGVLDRPPASVDGFTYSRDLTAAAASFTWSTQTLAAYLADPVAFLRQETGNDSARSRMTFKLSDPDEIQSVIDYLETLK